MAEENNERGFFTSRANIALVVFLAIGGFYLVSEHWAHVVGVGPLVLLLVVCVGMHFFMHSGHGSHGSGGADGSPPGADRTPGGRHRTGNGGELDDR